MLCKQSTRCGADAIEHDWHEWRTADGESVRTELLHFVLLAQMFDSEENRRNWDVNVRHNVDYCTVFDAEQCCYLSSEADEVLEAFDENTVYIIGGIVDHNSRKGLCKRLAEERRVRTARLPIDRQA